MGFLSSITKGLFGGASSGSNKVSMPTFLSDPAKGLVSQAYDYLNQNQQYPGFTPFQQQGLEQMGEMAQAGSPIYGQARDIYSKTLGGDYLSGNPYLESQIDRASGDVVRNYNMVAKPQMEAAMVRSGSFGNAGLQQMQGEQQRRLMDTLGNISSGMRFQNYGMERQNQVNAMNNAAGFDAARYNDADRLFGAGTVQQQQALNQQQYPMQQMRQFANILNPMMGTFAGQQNKSFSADPGSVAKGAATVGGFLGLLSDRRAKEDIKKVGKTDGGLPVYTYKYKGLPGTHMGVMAQEARKQNPDAVRNVGGLLAVDYSGVK